MSEIRGFAQFCFCPEPNLDDNDICVYGVQWVEAEKTESGDNDE